MEKMELAGNFDQAAPWKPDRIFGGYYREVVTIPGCESRKLVFDLGNKETTWSCWETKKLSAFTARAQVGRLYMIRCLGKTQMKNGKGWDFDCYAVSEPSEAKNVLEQLAVQQGAEKPAHMEQAQIKY